MAAPMQSKWLGRGAFAALVVGIFTSSGAMSGCATERDPISRIQQGALAKSFFLGPSITDFRDDPEFRAKSFNIDSAANTDNFQGTIGGASAIERVRFDITEDYLFARRSYQETPGSDNRGLPRKQVSPGVWEFPSAPTGTIIAAYKIESHFDVRRSYNPSTGEDLNIIEENSTDRPWYQREYFRVDWSQNLAQSTSGDISWVFGEGTDATAIQYSQTNDTDPDKPNFDNQNGYFDITNKYQLKSSSVGIYNIPECVLVGFLNGATSFDCTPTEVTMRTSYVKLTGDEDFEPFEEDRAFLDVVGNWGNAGNDFDREYGGAPTTAWDPQYGYTDANTHTYYSIHNIWEKSHLTNTCDSNADADNNGTADECEPSKIGYPTAKTGSHGSQCDTIVGQCTIPIRDRQVKTIGYWLNADAPQDLTDQVSQDGKTVTTMGPIEENTYTWNQMMKVSVAYRREVECRRTGDGNRDSCHQQFFNGTGAQSKQMVRFGGWGIDTPVAWPSDKNTQTSADTPIVATCHNPVRAYDLPMCGKPGDVVRLGDIRKNYAIYWPYASRAPYGGVASIGGDPVTGEMLGVTATIMMRSATFAAAQQRDIIALANGDIKIDDIITGAQATNYVSHVKDGKVVDGLGQAKSLQEIQQTENNVQLSTIQAAVGNDPKQMAAATPLTLQLKAIQLRAKESAVGGNIGQANLDLDALMAKMNGSQYKSSLANRGLTKLLSESSNTNSAVYNAINTVAQQDPNHMQDIMDQYQAYLGQKGVCFTDATIAGAGSIYQPSLAPYFKNLYGTLDPIERGLKVYNDLLHEAIKGIAFHEIGHSLGLRHNFASSWDAMNYMPQYWQLRTNEGQSTASCGGKPRNPTTDTCMGPRYLDPYSNEEQGTGSEPRPGIEYFGNTSTMEYQIERFGETAGAGTYDLHAMETLYGRVLETFDSTSVSPSTAALFAATTLSQGISSDLVLQPAKNILTAHYTTAATMAKVFDPARDCRDATDDEKASAKWRIVHGKVCAQGPRNRTDYYSMNSDPITFKIGSQVIPIGQNGVRWTGKDEAGQPLVRWEYRYGEDYSRGGYIHAKAFDSGADIYETTLNAERRLNVTYPWQYFRRQNKEFAWWSIPNVVSNNVFARMRAYHWTTTTDIGRADAAALADDDQQAPEVFAAKEMFHFLQHMILHPEPGSYGLGEGTNERTPIRPPGQPTPAFIYDVQTDAESVDASSIIGNLGLVDGRYVQIDFDNGIGGSWDYAKFPTHAPFDEEKALAFRELVDSRPTLSTVTRDNALDGRDPYISFRTDFAQGLDRLVGGLLAEDWETIAPSMNSDGLTTTDLDVLPADPSTISRPAGNKGIVFPNMGYSNQINIGIFGLIYSRFSTDMVMANKMRIRNEGDSGPIIPVDRMQAFTDPVTGIRYIATKFGTETINGRAVDTGIGSRMLARASELGAAAYGYDTVAGANAQGEYTYNLVNGQPVITDATQAQALRRYVGLLDAMREVGDIFGIGPLGFDDGDDQ